MAHPDHIPENTSGKDKPTERPRKAGKVRAGKPVVEHNGEVRATA